MDAPEVSQILTWANSGWTGTSDMEHMVHIALHICQSARHMVHIALHICQSARHMVQDTSVKM
uniref:Uncharacterized protein n=1 Tax=Setaria viridis TaxID=4556 RepID=A0A4U6UAJ6_SETVI|nr:hypothetical protein SEVIR_6G169250v2 [Setaria viridis]